MIKDLVDAYLAELSQVLAGMPRDQIWSVVEELQQAWTRGRQVFIMGNGGSAATSSHMANDLNKFTVVPGQPRFKAFALTDNIACVTAWANDSAYEDIFVEQLVNFLEADDIVIGISTSGNSLNVLKALRFAQDVGATTIGFTGRDGGGVKRLVDICVCVPSDHIGMQEDCHMILDHIIATVLRVQICAQAGETLQGLPAAISTLVHASCQEDGPLTDSSEDEDLVGQERPFRWSQEVS